MSIASARWLGLSYFTCFFCYGVYLPFWGIWLKSLGMDAERIGLLLGCAMVARFLGSFFITSQVKHPSYLIRALRLMALIACLFVSGFWLGEQWLWLLLTLIGFSLFFAAVSPLNDALAATWTQQIGLKYGPVRLWGSLAFVMSSSLTGLLVSHWSSQAILAMLSTGVGVMLCVMLLTPSVVPLGETQQEESGGGWRAWQKMLAESEVWRFVVCVTLLQGAHAAYYSFSAIWWQQCGYSSTAIGHLWSLGVVAEIIIFALSNRLFHRWTINHLLLLSGVCALIRWTILGSTTELSLLIVSQILHCGSFTICHLAAMRFIATRRGAEIIRLQSLYSALAMGGGIAVMTMICGLLYTHLQGHLFWLMALMVIPALFLRPRVAEPARMQTADEQG